MTQPLAEKRAEEVLTPLRSFETDIPAFVQVICNAYFSSKGGLPARIWLHSQQQLATLIGGSVLILDEADANELAHSLAQGAPSSLRTSCGRLLCD